MIPSRTTSCSINQGKRGRAGRENTCLLGLWCLLIVVLLSGCARDLAVGLEPQTPGRHYTWDPTSTLFVDSLQPTLRWEAFPRPEDREADREGLLSRISDVTYDLKIWKAPAGDPGWRALRGVVIHLDDAYTRQGLPHPWHELEIPLEPCTKYFWTIRAKFRLDGDLRVIQWAGLTNERRLQFQYYRFKTPCE